MPGLASTIGIIGLTTMTIVIAALIAIVVIADRRHRHEDD